jgi:hypothetical protein
MIRSSVGLGLEAGLADEFGSGKRYFGSVDRQYLLEDPDVDIRGDRVLHLRGRVRR